MDNTVEVFNQLMQNAIPFEENISLKSKTWIKRGGKARYYITPEDASQLEASVAILNDSHIPYHLIGHTSNIYFVNSYNPAAVISCSKMTACEETESHIWCECGVSVTKLSRKMIEEGYAGFEGLVGLPGTVGGAIVNNSSAFGYSLCKLAEEIVCLNEKRERISLTVLDLKIGERTTSIKRKESSLIVLKVKLRKEVGDVDILRERAEHFQKIRASLQAEKIMNLGSCFQKLSGGLLLKSLLGVRFITRNVIKVFCSKKIQQKQYERILFYTLAGHSVLTRYVDVVQPNCFLWRDEAADDVFFNHYLPFMKKYYRAETLEIEIIR